MAAVLPDRRSAFPALMRAVDLEWMFADPEWGQVPDFEDTAHRRQFWEMLLERIQARTLAEWTTAFDADEDVWAEVFRHGNEVLDHPQFVYDGDVVEVDDPDRGAVRQPAPQVRIGTGPKPSVTAAPRLGDYQRAGRPARQCQPASDPAGPHDQRMPLEGIVVTRARSTVRSSLRCHPADRPGRPGDQDSNPSKETTFAI